MVNSVATVMVHGLGLKRELRLLMARLVIAAIAALVGLSPTGSASAQTSGLLSVPAEKLMTGPGGVDIRSGRYNYSQTDLSIGDEAGGLNFTRTIPSNVPQLTDLPF